MKKLILMLFVMIGLTSCAQNEVKKGRKINLTPTEIISAELYVEEGDDFNFVDIDINNVDDFVDKVVEEINSRSNDSIGITYPSKRLLRIEIKTSEFENNVIITLYQISNDGAYYLTVNTGEKDTIVNELRYSNISQEIVTEYGQISYE